MNQNERIRFERVGQDSPELVLGPILRAGDGTMPSVWVETSVSCQVEVLNETEATFCVGGHHYAIVDLPDAAAHSSYDVRLDGITVWPDPVLGPSTYAMWEDPDAFRLAAGSCRQQAPAVGRPWRRKNEARDAEVDRLGPDALAALAACVQTGQRPMPHLLMLMGDQVYADEQHKSVTQALEDRRGGPPNDGYPQVTSFEEYTWLYQATWSHPSIRWMLSAVPSLMIFDDHDVIDDWNISDTWVEDTQKKPWWDARLRSALMSYWVYQHLGNMSAQERATDQLFSAIRASDDGYEALASYVDSVSDPLTNNSAGSWTFTYSGGPMSMIVLDARNGRQLEPQSRSMLSNTDWDHLDATMETTDRHLLVVSSVPWILPPSIHRLERLASRLVRERQPGSLVSWLAERLRRAIDLEHWAAFDASFESLARRFESLGNRDRPPTSQIVLSGDVHFACVAEYALPHDTSVLQVIASPMRQAERSHETWARRAIMTRPANRALNWLLSLTTGRGTPAGFEVTDGPWFDNNLAYLEYGTEQVSITLEKATLDPSGRPRLEPLLSRIVGQVKG